MYLKQFIIIIIEKKMQSTASSVFTSTLILGIFAVALTTTLGIFIFQNQGFHLAPVSISSIDDTIVLNVNVTNPSQLNLTVDIPSTINVVVLNPVTEVNVTVLNPVTVVSVDNFPPQEPVNITFPSQIDVNVLNSDLNVIVLNPVTSVTVDNLPAVQNVYVTNPTTQLNVTLDATSISINNFPSEYNVNVLNDLNVTVLNTNLSVNVLNPVTTVTVENLPAVQSVFVLNPTTQVNVSLDTSSISVNNFPTNQPVTVTNGPILNSQDQLLVSVANPTTAYENLMTESLQPVFQTDAIYGINTVQVFTEEIGTATVTASDSSFVINSGSTTSSYAMLQSRDRLKYKNGQGSRCVFSAAFTDTAADNSQFVGLSNAEDSVMFGYNASSVFGILYQERGNREVRLLTITGTPSASASVITVTLNSVVYYVAVTPVTASASIMRKQIVYAITKASFPSWQLQPIGETVYFVSTIAGSRSGTYSYADTGGSTGSFTQSLAGSDPTESFIPQTQWNMDTLNGLGPSRIVLYPSLFNVYMISLQSADSGGIRFFVGINGNVTQPVQFVNVHTIATTNSRTQSTFGNPSFPFMAILKNLGSASNSTLKISSFSGFTEGSRYYTGNTMALEYIQGTETGTTEQQAVYSNVYTIQNALFYGNRVSQAVVRLISISTACFATTGAGPYYPVRFAIFKSAGPVMPTFTPYSSTTGVAYPSFDVVSADTSILSIDTGVQKYTVDFNYNLIWTGSLASGTSGINVFADVFKQDITLQPGEYLTIAMYPYYLVGSTMAGTPGLTINIDY